MTAIRTTIKDNTINSTYGEEFFLPLISTIYKTKTMIKSILKFSLVLLTLEILLLNSNISAHEYSSENVNLANGEGSLSGTATLSLDPSNATGAGGVNINTVSCTSGYEILDNTNTGVIANFNSSDGVKSITITLTNPQDLGDESLSIGGIFPGVLVAGNGTTQLILTNDGTASDNGMRNALDDLFYLNNAASPNTVITREVDIFFTSYTDVQSNTATAFFDVTQAAKSGVTSGTLNVFNTDPMVDLFSVLDGSQDMGGTWVDLDATGALSGSSLNPTLLPLGGSSFRYDVTSTSPCPTASTTVVIINLNSSEVPISAPTACGSFITAYSDPLYSANSNDPIYTFDGGTSAGELTSELGGVGTVYTWYKYDPASNSYKSYAGNNTATQTGLTDGGYLVVRNDGGTIEEGRAWVWNTSTSPDAGMDQFVCTGSSVTLNGATTITNPTFTYYDPVERPFIIDASTNISITFDAVHTYVSDLGFYAVNPSGTSNIELGANQGNTCNSGNNITSLTFTNNPADGTFNFCTQAAPLTGSYSSFFNGNVLAIDWSGWYGENARASGWAVQIYDCVGADVGALTGVVITFDDGAGNVVTYASPGGLNSPINDNSCTPATASKYVVPGNPSVPNTASVAINDGIGIGGAGGYQWSYSTDSNTGPWSSPFENASLTPTITINQEIWFRLQIDNSTPCIGEDIVHFTIENQAYGGYALDSAITNNIGVVNLFGLLVNESIGGVWSVIGGTPGVSFNSAAGTFDAGSAPGDTYTFRYTVPPTAPCVSTDQTDIEVILTVNQAPAINNNSSAATNTATFAENGTGNVIDWNATDADGETENGGGLTYALTGTDAALFTLDTDTGELTFTAAPDFESPNDAGANNVYDVIVTVSDAASATDVQALAITVTDVVEVANFTIDAIADTNVDENTIYNGVTPNLSGDAPIGAVTYTLSGTDAADFTIDPATGEVSMIARDFESPVDDNTDNVYALVITATDADGNSDTEDWTVTVDDVIEVANFTIDAIADTNVDENTIYNGVTPNLSGDAPIGTITYTLSGTDASDFTIDPATGEVSMIARDFESPVDDNTDNVYELIITATDADGNSDTEDWTVTVDDVIEPMVFTIDEIVDIVIDENTAYSGVLPVISGTPIGNITYSLIGAEADLFAIDPVTGVVTMIARDFENPEDGDGDNIYNITIQATDDDQNADTEAWTITVQNVVETANFTIDTIGDVLLSENTMYTSETPTLSGDSPIGDVTYTLSGDDTAIFTIDPETGVVTMIGQAFDNPQDANSDNVYEITIIATDADGNTATVSWVLEIDPEDLKVYTGFSPNNGNADSDHWEIAGINKYPNNEVRVYNRWGNLVYEIKGYDNTTNVWRGESNKGIVLGKKQLPDGSYFYIIDKKDGSKPQTGYVVIYK